MYGLGSVSGQFTFCNTAFSEYFTNGIVEPHIMLLDLHYCTGKIKNHTPKYFKILE